MSKTIEQRIETWRRSHHLVRNRVMQSVIALALFLSTSVTPGQEYPNPPKPRLHNPVDYIAWVNKTYGGSIKINAADKYKAAFDAYAYPSWEALDTWGGGLYRGAEGGPTTAAGWVLANKRSLRLFREATEIRDCYFQRTPSESGLLMEVLMPYLANFRNMSKLLRTRARSQFDSGDVNGAVEDLLLILRSARHLEAQPSTLDHLTSLALLRLAYSTMMDWLTAGNRALDYESTLRRFMHEDMLVPVPRSQLLMDKVMSWDMFQKMPAVDGQEAVLKTQNDVDIAVAELERLARPYYELYAEEYAKGQKLSEELDGELTLERIRNRAKSTHATPRMLAIWMVVDREMNMLSLLWHNAVLHRRITAERNAVYALLAVNAFKAKHGHWPKSLVAAMPDGLAAYRSDPFSGKDLVYRVAEGKPVLYSVSLDGKDDGGKGAPKRWRETGDAVFSPSQGH